MHYQVKSAFKSTNCNELILAEVTKKLLILASLGTNRNRNRNRNVKRNAEKNVYISASKKRRKEDLFWA
jgi:hypothetical protein